LTPSEKKRSPHGVKSQNTPLYAVTCHRECGADAIGEQALTTLADCTINIPRASNKQRQALVKGFINSRSAAYILCHISYPSAHAKLPILGNCW
jgi:hypothetical protein